MSPLERPLSALRELWGERPLDVALACSLTIHLLLVGGLPGLRSLRFPEPLRERRWDEMEIAYFRLAERTALRPDASQPPAPSPERPPARLPELPTPKLPALPEIKPTLPASSEALLRPTPETVDLTDLSKQAQLDASTLEYFAAIRERIRQSAKRTWLQAPARTAGRVFLSFQLLANGRLGESRVDPQRSTGDAMLQSLSLESLRRAEPFPSFPASLREPHKIFNILIEYEIK